MEDPWMQSSIDTFADAKKFRESGHGSTIGGLITDDTELRNPSHYLSESRIKYARSRPMGDSSRQNSAKQEKADLIHKIRAEDPWKSVAEQSYVGESRLPRESLAKLGAERRAREEARLEEREAALCSASGRQASARRQRVAGSQPVGDFAAGPISLWYEPDGSPAPVSEYDERYRTERADTGSEAHADAANSLERSAESPLSGARAKQMRQVRGGAISSRQPQGTAGNARPRHAQASTSPLFSRPANAKGTRRARGASSGAPARASVSRVAAARASPARQSAGRQRRPLLTPTQREELRRAHSVAAKAARSAAGAAKTARGTGPGSGSGSGGYGQSRQAAFRTRQGRSQGKRAFSSELRTATPVSYADAEPTARTARGPTGNLPLPGDEDGELWSRSDRTRANAVAEAAEAEAEAEAVARDRLAAAAPLEAEGIVGGDEMPSVVAEELSRGQTQARVVPQGTEGAAVGSVVDITREQEQVHGGSQCSSDARQAAREARAAMQRSRIFAAFEEEEGGGSSGPHGKVGAAHASRAPPFAVGPPPVPQQPQAPHIGSADQGAAHAWRRTATSYLMSGQDPPAELDPPPRERRPIAAHADPAVGASGTYGAVAPPPLPGAAKAREHGRRALDKRRYQLPRSRSPVQVNRRFPPRPRRERLSEYDAKFAPPAMLADRNPFLPRR